MIYSVIKARIHVVAKASFTSTRLCQQASKITSSCISSCVQRKQLIEDSNADISLHNINDNKLPSTQNHRTYPCSNKMGSTAVNNATTSHQCTSESEANAPITDIEELHHQAILDKQSTYIDPATGFTVFTELAHLKRGKCCGNQCRHCPYGWSNVRNENGGFNQNDTGRVVSGDREGAARLVKRILNGTYYEEEEEDECTMQNGGTTQQVSTEELNGTHNGRSQKCNNTTDDSESINDRQNKTINSTSTIVVGKGGSAGGTLTSKNVPYTRKGDTGTSQLFTGERRNKDDVLFEALGTVDELCSIVGVVYAELNTPKTNNSMATTYGNLPEQLLDVMSRLFDVGSHIAKPTPQNGQSEESSTGDKSKSSGFHSHHTSLLEEWIDTMTDELPELTSFILPTGSPASAQLHVARTVCRRAERRMVPLVQDERTVDPDALAYVNRLSDFFFTAARFVNYCEDRDEVQYRREERGSDSTGSARKGVNFQRERVVVKLKK